MAKRRDQSVHIPLGSHVLAGDLVVPENPGGIVLFAHGSGSSRHSPRNRFVAQVLRRGGLATLLFDLLTPEEEEIDLLTRQLRFDIELLTDRLLGATDWVQAHPETWPLPLGYFGASTGSAAALQAAARRTDTVRAVVSHGGRPDLAPIALPLVLAPTLLIVGASDYTVLELNQQALQKLRCTRHLEVVPRATHLFEEPGALETVADLALQWFARHLPQSGHTPPTPQ